MNTRYTTGGQKETPRGGQHLARCIGVIDMGTQMDPKRPEKDPQRKVRITWELPNTLMEGTYKQAVKGKPFVVHRKLTMSLHEKSTFRAMLNAWRGKAMSEADIQTFDDRKLLGLPCLVTLTPSASGTALVDAVLPPIGLDGAKIACPPQVNPSTYLSLDPKDFDPSVYSSLPDWMKDEIAKSPEYRKLFAQAHDGAGDTPTDDEAAAATAPADDVPF